VNSSLKTKTARALSWSLVQEIAQRGLQFGIGILLARLLAPEQFGLVAMLTIFFAVAQALLDSGFGSALIQRKDPTPTDESSVFYFNLFLGCAMAGMLYLAAPWIAAFYEQPRLTSMTRLWSVVLIINSFGIVQTSLMVRNLDFKRQAAVSVTSGLVSGAIAVVLAWRGMGVWSLVWQQVSNSAVRACMLWIVNQWRPQPLFSFQSLREMFTFGSNMMANSLLNTFFDNLYSLVIGKLFSPVTLGYYNRASNLQNHASQSLAMMANRVTFPVFSRLQDDPARLKRGLQKAMTTLAFVQFPLLIGLAAVAKPMVLVLLTEKWAASIPYLQLLCFAGLLYPVHLLNLNILIALGRSDLFFRIGVLKRVLMVLNIAVTWRWGVMALLWGQVLNSFIAYFLNSMYTKRFTGYSMPEQLRNLAPYALASLLMGLVVYFVNLPLPPGHIAQLAVKIGAGIATYALACCGMRLKAVHEIADLIARVKRPAVIT
jgi:teichuronic acid exporter